MTTKRVGRRPKRSRADERWLPPRHRSGWPVLVGDPANVALVHLTLHAPR